MRFDPAAEGWRQHPDRALPPVALGQWVREEAAGFAFGFETDPNQESGGGMVHGGTLATFIDHTMGRVARNAAGGRVATIQLDVQYLVAVRPGAFVIARGAVTRLTRSVIFLRGTLHVEDQQVLAATGVWKILGK